MRNQSWSVFKLIVSGFAALSVLGALAGDIAAQTVKAGDKVETAFTCRLSSGAVAATTDAAVAADASIAKSLIYQPRQAAEPLVLPAGGGESAYGSPGKRGFEGEVVARIGQLIVGMAPGETRQAQLTAERAARQQGEHMVVEMARVRERAKFMKMSLDEYRGRTRQEPNTGDSFTLDPAFPGRITAVSDTHVTVEFSAQVGARIQTGIGEGEIRDAGKNWEVVIGSQRGDLVRTGAMVGRVADVDERMITIDYSHPFGGEVLNCDITVNKVTEGQP